MKRANNTERILTSFRVDENLEELALAVVVRCYYLVSYVFTLLCFIVFMILFPCLLVFPPTCGQLSQHRLILGLSRPFPAFAGMTFNFVVWCT